MAEAMRTRVYRAARHGTFWRVHEALVSACRSRHRRALRGARSRVLVVKPDGIGDFVLFSCIAEAVRRFAGERELVLACSEAVAGLLPLLPRTFDAAVLVDETQYRRSPLSRLRTLSRIRGLGCESVLHPVYSRGVIGDELALCSGIPERIAFAGDASNMPARCHERNNRLYTRLISTEPGREIERYWQFARALNGNGELKRTWPRLVPGPLRPAIAEALAGFGAFYAMCPGAAAPYRRWGTHNYARLARWVHQRYGLRPVICGTAEDVTLAEEIAGHVPCGVLSLCGRTSVADLAGVLQKGAFYVGSETGAVHVAAALGVPTVCIIGGGHFGRFYPYVQEVAQPPPAGESAQPRVLAHGHAGGSSFATQFPPKAASPAPVRQPLRGAAGPHGTLHVAAYRRMDCFGCNWRCVRDRPTCVESVPFDRVVAGVEQVMTAPGCE